MTLRIGIDTGGTFTDFVVYAPQTNDLHTFKVPSTPHDPAEAVLRGLARLIPDAPDIVHGTTVATNALLERKGARTALLTTRGFRDLLRIGRQERPALYDFFANPAPHLAALCLEVDERIGPDGEILHPLDESALPGIIAALRQDGAQSVAVCTLFSFANPAHEVRLTAALRAAGFFVSASHEICPEFREYERASTTVINASLSPVLERYLQRLEALPGRLRVMASNGGLLSPAEAGRGGARCVLSGPAGGIIGALAVGGQVAPRLLTFDMGGTSTDVALIEGQPHLTTEAAIGGLPIRLPMLDIHTIGAGGGSLAYADAGGALRVGPQSAGADPGPACYGKGERPTVTDANLFLGRILPEHFLGGEMPLYPPRSAAALERLGAALGLNAVQTALGIVEVVNEHMARALRLISVERGHDPRRFVLLAFGGAGGLHAVALARRLHIPQVIIPPLAATLSAYGMIAADEVSDYAQTIMLRGTPQAAEIREHLQPLLTRVSREMPEAELTCSLDVRYRGQSYELTVPLSPDYPQAFHVLHQREFGYTQNDVPLEVVTGRVRATRRVPAPVRNPHPTGGPDPSPALTAVRAIQFSTGRLDTPVYRGEDLHPGNRIPGPALIVRADTTILLPPASRADVDAWSNVVIETMDGK
ncbi:MAG: hydantoinase/oxoprolinase family protein [Anaerolineales bacterium]